MKYCSLFPGEKLRCCTNVSHVQLHRHATSRNVSTSPVSADCFRGRPSEEVSVQVVLLTELVRDGDAGEVLAPVALHRVDVEEDGQGGEQAQEHHQEDADLDTLPVHVGTPEAGEQKLALC